MFQTGHSKVGGRKCGSKNKKTLLSVNELLLSLDINPIEKLINIAESNDASVEQQIRCWQEITKYAHPRLKSQEMRIETEPVGPIEIHLVSPDGTREKVV